MTEEDTELAEMVLKKYQQDIQNELNRYNQQNAIYQQETDARLTWYRSIATQRSDTGTTAKSGLVVPVSQDSNGQAQASSSANTAKAQLMFQRELQEYTLRLETYKSNLQKYQLEINAEVQEYTLTHIQRDMAIFNTNRTNDIQKFSNEIQNELNKFNEGNVEYQTELQMAIKNADLEDGADKDALQKYQLDISTWQQEINSVIQKWINEEWNQNFLKYQTDYASLLQTYQADVQNELNEFNKESAVYQAQLQISIQDAQLSSQDDAQKIQKYGAEVGTYQHDMNKEIQDFVNTLQKESQEYQSNVTVYTSDIQKYQAEYSSSLQKYQTEIGEKTAKIGSATQNAAYYSAESKKYYEWANNEVSMYIQNNQKMINQTISANAKAQAAQYSKQQRK